MTLPLENRKIIERFKKKSNFPAFLMELDLNGIEIDRYKRQQLEEFVSFRVSQKKPLGFTDVQQNIGLSRRQCEIIRSNNPDSIQWKNE